VLGVLGVLVLIGIIASLTSNGQSPATSTTASHPSAAPAASQHAGQAPARKKTVRPRVIARFSGSGIENTARFHIGGKGDWLLKWNYSCAAFGDSGNFIVDEDGGSNFNGASVNELGTGGHGSTHVYSDSGRHYLAVDSECHWTVRVVGTP
jgi:hypothetical protein